MSTKATVSNSSESLYKVSFNDGRDSPAIGCRDVLIELRFVLWRLLMLKIWFDRGFKVTRITNVQLRFSSESNTLLI
jgi:hypothetical protein